MNVQSRLQLFVVWAVVAVLAVNPAEHQKALEKGIEHGIGFRIRLPYQHPKITSVRLGGRVLPKSDADGWQSWLANGFTQVQINLPPEKAAQQDLFLLTCEYQPDVVRRQGWTPPKEVVEQLRK